MQPLVSVIVPVYKVENVLTRCLDSLGRQSLKNIEILLIDDASPDRCGAICETVAAKDSRFRVIHHPENRGLSAARNTGIAHAASDYLMFVDSDDYVHEDFCRLPYECAVQNSADLVMFRRYHIDKNGLGTTLQENINRKTGMVTQGEAIKLLLTDIVGNTAWNKLYKKELFCIFTYPEGYYFEDIGTTYKLILNAESVYYIDRKLYYWCHREGSITNTRAEKALSDWGKMQIQQYHDLVAWGYPTEKLEPRLKSIALTYCMRKKEDMKDPNYIFCRKTLQVTRVIPKYFTWRRKVLFVLLKYCPLVFDLVCNLWGKRWKIVE